MTYRTGLGYDVHRFSDGRVLMLGGIEIPHTQGLAGHSDADVVLHAIADGLLGAVAQGDIGEHFPDTDPQYKNISSTTLLQTVNDVVKRQGYQVVNIDVMILAEAPRLAAYKKNMAAHIADTLVVEHNCVNVKAGTNECMGFVGRKEGIAAYAQVLLEKREKRKV